VEGEFDPALVTLLPLGYAPRSDMSPSETNSADDGVSDLVSESDYGGEEDAKKEQFTEVGVLEWLYSAGFPQYVDMSQSNPSLFFGKFERDLDLMVRGLLGRARDCERG